MSDRTIWEEVSEAISMGDYEPSSWEDEFLSDIEDKLDNLSGSQREKLQEIHQLAT